MQLLSIYLPSLFGIGWLTLVEIVLISKKREEDVLSVGGVCV